MRNIAFHANVGATPALPLATAHAVAPTDDVKVPKARDAMWATCDGNLCMPAASDHR